MMQLLISGAMLGLSIGDVKGRVRYLEANVNQLAFDLGRLAEVSSSLSDRIKALGSALYREKMQSMAESSEIVRAWVSRQISKLANPDEKVIGLIQDVLNDTSHEIIPALRLRDGFYAEGEIFVKIKYLTQRMVDLGSDGAALSLREQIHQLRDHVLSSIDSVQRVINLVGKLSTSFEDSHVVSLISDQCNQNMEGLHRLRECISRIQIGTADSLIIRGSRQPKQLGNEGKKATLL